MLEPDDWQQSNGCPIELMSITKKLHIVELNKIESEESNALLMVSLVPRIMFLTQDLHKSQERVYILIDFIVFICKSQQV